MSINKLSRAEVYLRIDSERAYQGTRWGDKIHSVPEWLVYIRNYMNEAEGILSREADEVAVPKSLEIMRKLAGMCVCALEQHGCNFRKGFEQLPTDIDSCGESEELRTLREEREGALQALGLHPDCDTTILADEIRRLRQEGRDHFHSVTQLQPMLSEIAEELVSLLSIVLGDNKYPDVSPSTLPVFKLLAQKARMTASLHRQASFDNFRKWEAAKKDARTVSADVDNLTQDNVALQKQNQAMQTEIDTYAKELGSLLAIILRDGGQYQAENGIFASIEKAKGDVLADRRNLNDFEALGKERDKLQSIVRRAYLMVLKRLTPEQEKQLGFDLAAYGAAGSIPFGAIEHESEEARNLRKMRGTEG